MLLKGCQTINWPWAPDKLIAWALGHLALVSSISQSYRPDPRMWELRSLVPKLWWLWQCFVVRQDQVVVAYEMSLLNKNDTLLCIHRQEATIRIKSTFFSFFLKQLFIVSISVCSDKQTISRPNEDSLEAAVRIESPVSAQKAIMLPIKLPTLVVPSTEVRALQHQTNPTVPPKSLL